MALPVAPIAGLALRYGAVALAAYTIARRGHHARRDQRAEDALDDLPEGIAMRRDQDQAVVTGRYCRTIRLGRRGPGVSIDATGLGRIRLRRLRGAD